MADTRTDDSQTSMAGAGRSVRAEFQFAVGFMRRHLWRLLLAFAGLLLPLWAFTELADEIHDQEAIPFDEPILHFARSLASDGFDRFFGIVSDLGYHYGVVPLDIALVVALTLLRRFREATFAAIALGGSGLLNVSAKMFFARERPSLWESIAPEQTFSFPSGHAMGSATLACVLALLAWRTRWRWPVVAMAGMFVVLVGLSRVYLGVHYPSDILAGWAAASVWAAFAFLLVFRGHLHPWRGAGSRAAG